jgi:GT2 family glycosyltransferase
MVSSDHSDQPLVPELSICMVAYQACQYLKECLDSLYQSLPRRSFEVIVVDNGSRDGTADMLRTAFPQVRLIVNTGNLGYTRPMNQALKAAVGRYRIQLNPDTLILPGAFDALADFMDAHPQAGICTPRVLNRDGSLQLQCRRSEGLPWDAFTYFSGLWRLFPHQARFAGYLMTYKDDREIFEVQAVSGSCMFIRTEVLEQVGFLDELFYAYQEDSDFCFQARKAGWKIYYLPQAEIVHYGGEGGTRVHPYRSVYEWHRSYFLYYRKNFARDYFFLANGLVYGLMFVKYLIAVAKIFFSKEKYPATRKP